MGSILALAINPWAAPVMKLFVAGVVAFGAIASANHFFCHAFTHRHDIPALYLLGHKFGLLPSPRHHKTHHTAPFDCNWNFLNGLYQLYEPLYKVTGESYTAMQMLFYTTNPVSIQLIALACHNCL